jgi:hypothetical protein
MHMMVNCSCAFQSPSGITAPGKVLPVGQHPCASPSTCRVDHKASRLLTSRLLSYYQHDPTNDFQTHRAQLKARRGHRARYIPHRGCANFFTETWLWRSTREMYVAEFGPSYAGVHSGCEKLFAPSTDRGGSWITLVCVKPHANVLCAGYARSRFGCNNRSRTRKPVQGWRQRERCLG